MPKKQNDFGLKYGNKKHSEKAEWVNDMTRKLEGFEAEIHIDLHKTTLKHIKLENA